MKIRTLIFRAKLELMQKLKLASLDTKASSKTMAVFVFHCSGLNSTQWRQLKTLFVEQNTSKAAAEIFFLKNPNKAFNVRQRSYQKENVVLAEFGVPSLAQHEKTRLQTLLSTQTRGPICLFYLSQESSVTSGNWSNIFKHMEAANLILLYGRFVRRNENESYNEIICNHIDIKQSMNLETAQQIPVLTQSLGSIYHPIQTLYYCLTFLTKNKSSVQKKNIYLESKAASF